MIRNSKKVITIVGGGNIGSSWALLFLLHGYRVNIYDKDCEVHYKSKKSIKIGEKFSESNLTVKRPGTGICPMQWDDIMNQKSKKYFNMDDLIEI